MMYDSSFSGASLVGFHFHWIFCTLFFFGLVAAIVWLARFASKQQLKKMIWTGLLLGGVGMLLTAGFAFRGMREMMDGEWGSGDSEEEDSSQENEEGKDEKFEDMRDFMEYMMDYDEEEESSSEEAAADTSTAPAQE